MELIRIWLHRFPFTLGFDKGGDAPPPPPAPVDPSAAIYAQARALPSYYGPGGSKVYSGDPNAGTLRLTETLAPDQQRLYDQRQDIARSLLGRSETALKRTAPTFQFQGAEDPATNRLFTESQKLLDRQFGRQEEDLEQRLANKGLPMGSEAYQEEFRDFRDQRSDAYQRAAADALEGGSRLALTERQQQLNEIAQALGGSQLTPVGTAGQPIDTMGPMQIAEAGRQRQHQGQLAAYNADIARQNSLTGGLFGLGAAYLMSDRRVKTDVVYMREYEPGIGLYQFRYLWEPEDARHLGFMADEVERVYPRAVATLPSGLKAVNYGWMLNHAR